MKPVLFWFKNDLRLHDNEALHKAVNSEKPIIFFFCLDERLFKKNDLGFRKADAARYLFLKESVEDLQEKLEGLDAHLMIEFGKAEELIPKLVKKYGIQTIFAEREYASEELEIIDNLKASLPEETELDFSWGKTLYHIDDIPFSIDKIPLTSKAYRIPTGKKTSVRDTFKTPKKLKAFKEVESTDFPGYRKCGFYKKELDAVNIYEKGGEAAALERLEEYTFGSENLTGYRWSRNKSMGMDYSSKFSPYLAVGSLSPRTIYFKIQEYEKKIKKNQSTWWLVFELVWRDYFTFKAMRIGNAIFKTEGFRKKKLEFKNDQKLFQRWCEGKTGIPFVDAHMRQLNQTGYMSNRGRVNCASFMVHDYQIDWTWGAAYFESKLIDYDVTSNWMNWHMQAYEIWYTNPIHQSLKYKSADFIRNWIPELKNENDFSVYLPWENDVSDYPKPDELFDKWGRSINKIKKKFED